MKSNINFTNENIFPEYLNKRKQKKTKLKNNINHNSIIKHFILIFISFLPLIFNMPIKRKESFYTFIQSYSNEITIKIEGKGQQIITSSIYNLCPDHIYLDNDDLKGEDCHIVDIPDSANEINTLRLVWDTETTFLAEIFENITNIVEVDLSKYDTSKVESMLQMFWNCSSLTSVNLTNTNTSLVTSMRLMFGECISLRELDVSKFDTSRVTDMHFMFSNCVLLTSLDVSHFDTSKVSHFEGMFAGMVNLESINVRNFDTSQAINMHAMFYRCNSSTVLNVSSFNTALVTDMSLMFYDDYNLKFLDLSNFDTSEVVNINHMFAYCRAMTSLGISNFRTPKLKSMIGLFLENNQLTSIDLSGFDTKQVTSMEFVFYGIGRVSVLDLTPFDTSNVKNMSYMICHTDGMTSLIISNLNTSSVVDFNHMFRYTVTLTSLDLTHFDTSQATDMHNMFMGCWNLQKLNISTFDTHLVENMDSMFSDCISLTSLDISNFDTSKVNNMFCMFINNINLEEIHLTNIKTSSMNNMVGIFYNCINLKYIDIRDYAEISDYLYIGQSLDYVPENVVVCIDESNLNSIGKFNEELVKKRCHVIYCGEDWKFKQKKMVYGTNLVCEQDCSNYKYEHEDWCYSYCPEGVDFCTPEDENAEEKTPIVTIDKYEPVISTSIKSTINSDTIHVSTNVVNYYTTEPSTEENNLSKISSDIKIDSTINNISVKLSTDNEDNSSNYILKNSNSIDNQNENLYNDSDNKSIDLADNISIIISNNNANDNNISEDQEDNNSDIMSNINSDIKEDNDNSENIHEINSVANNAQLYQEIINNYLQKNSPNEEKDVLVEGKDNYFYHITNTKDQKKSIKGINNSSKPISIVDLGQCENILKEHYHIDLNDSLIIVKFEKITNISTERTLQYEVYEPYNKTKLNLSICDNTTIDIYIPLVLSEELQNLYYQLKEKGYDLFDINGQFYQDICTPFTTPNGTDILLSDRISYYFHNNETLCQSNCQFSDYSIESQYLKCSCDTSNSKIDTKEIKNFTPKTLYESFYDILKYSNYKVLWCYKLAFHINSVTINKGSIIAIVYFSIYFIFFIIYCSKGIKELKIHVANKITNNFINPIDGIYNYNNKYNNIIEGKTDDNLKSHNSSSISNNNKRLSCQSKSGKTLANKTIQILNIYNYPPKKKSKSLMVNNESIKNKFSKHKKRDSKIHRKRSSDKNILISNKVFSIDKTREKFFDNKVENKHLDNETEKDIQEEKLDNFEINNLDYEEAVNKDKRSFFQIYWSILKREHLIIFTFFTRNDYNLIFIKFTRFIFLVCTDMAMNVFFFSDETMHKMYLDYGKYNFIQQIAQIVFSTVATQMIEVFICFLSLTDKHYYEIKNLKNEEKYNMFSILKCVERKIIFFYIFTFLLFAFYWYAIACFCAVYQNTQMAFITDSISSFLLGLLYPFILYLFPSILRLISLKAQKASCIYSISDIIPFF